MAQVCTGDVLLRLMKVDGIWMLARCRDSSRLLCSTFTHVTCFYMFAFYPKKKAREKCSMRLFSSLQTNSEAPCSCHLSQQLGSNIEKTLDSCFLPGIYRESPATLFSFGVATGTIKGSFVREREREMEIGKDEIKQEMTRNLKIRIPEDARHGFVPDFR